TEGARPGSAYVPPGCRATNGNTNDAAAQSRCPILFLLFVQFTDGRDFRRRRMELCRCGRRRALGIARRKRTNGLRTLATIDQAGEPRPTRMPAALFARPLPGDRRAPVR